MLSSLSSSSLAHLKWHLSWCIPILLFSLLAPFTPSLDIYISSFCFSEGHFVKNAFLDWMFTYGEMISFFVSAATLLLYIASLLWKKLYAWRKASLMLWLIFLIGAGFITHTLFKDHWGRPRPRQLEMFGGKYTYRPFWKPNFDPQRLSQKSFPSGHAAVGFYYVAFCFAGYQMRRRWLFYFGLLFTLFFGVGLFCTRILQGAHFFSDTLASALIMWLTTLCVYRYLFYIRGRGRLGASPPPEEKSA